MLGSTKWLLIAEINNEADGGDKPATLGSALESVRSGYNPDPDEFVDMEPVKRDLIALIAEHGDRAVAENSLTDSDWQEHGDGDLQARARKGH